ncbi:DNA fragmentation factor subunit beta [Lamellibrachia satsuma]|nr:DNA fragmentation factor subunit beta [Lamellibrachia satsuma]
MKDLLKKSCQKLAVDRKSGVRLVLEDDATVVDSEEYFSELPPQTVFVLLQANDTCQPSKTSPSHNLSLLLQFSRVKLSEEIQTLLEDNALSQGDRAILAQVSSSLKLTLDKETRAEDPDWFIGLEKTFQTKEDVMTELAKRRIRSYYYTAMDYIKRDKMLKADTTNLEALQTIVTKFQEELKENNYNGHYFARSSIREDNPCYCDDKGWFHCEGLFDQDACENESHMINPYGSREQRILFSTWNLDHRVEKSRQILPSLVQATLERPGGSEVNWRYFYSMLFTRDNLRLVHIVCHDKSEHVSYKCEEERFYVSMSHI